ncbi:MAG: tetratricopeptide repeat protein [Deltaproteobacteria bacterium]|nr:tetratricopeptide repeat protein [Deltaproteobacteria bacterium]
MRSSNMRYLRGFAQLTLAAVVATAWAAPSQTAQMLRAEATRLTEAKRGSEAIEALRKAVQESPDYVEAWTDLGNLLLAVPDYPAAAKAFSGALAVKPELGVARYNLAFALRKAGDFSRAAEAYKVYLARQPDDPDAWYGMAEALRGGGDALGAAESYDKYASLEKRTDRLAWVTKAREQAAELRAAMVAKERPKAAPPPTPAPSAQAPASPPTAIPPMQITASTGLESQKPKELALAIAEIKQSHFQAALDLLKPVALSQPDDPFINAALAAAYLGLKDAPRALALYQRAAAKAPSEAQGALALGIAEAARLVGDDDTAEAALEKAAASTEPAVRAHAVARLEE